MMPISPVPDWPLLAYLLQREPRMIEVDPETRDYSKAVRIWGTKFGSGDRVMRCRVHQGDVMGPAKTGDVQYLSDSEVLVTLPAGLEPGHCFIYLLREEPDCDVAESPAAGKAGRSANRSSSSQAVATEPYPGGKAKPKNSQAPPRVRMTLADGSTTWAVESHNFVHIFLNSPKKQDTNITIPVQSPQSERTDPDSPYSQSLSPWDYGSDNWSPGSNFSSDSDSMSPFFSGDIIGEGTFSMKRHLDYAERNVLHIAVLCRNAKLLSAAIKRATKLGVIKALLTGTVRFLLHRPVGPPIKMFSDPHFIYSCRNNRIALGTCRCTGPRQSPTRRRWTFCWRRLPKITNTKSSYQCSRALFSMGNQLFSVLSSEVTLIAFKSCLNTERIRIISTTTFSLPSMSALRRTKIFAMFLSNLEENIQVI